MRALELIEEENGKLSFARVLSGIIVLFILGLVTFITLKHGELPKLSDVTLFLTGSVTCLYGANKISAAITGKQ